MFKVYHWDIKLWGHWGHVNAFQDYILRGIKFSCAGPVCIQALNYVNTVAAVTMSAAGARPSPGILLTTQLSMCSFAVNGFVSNAGIWPLLKQWHHNERDGVSSYQNLDC